MTDYSDATRPMQEYTLVTATKTSPFGFGGIDLEYVEAPSPEEAVLGSVAEGGEDRVYPFAAFAGHHDPVWKADDAGAVLLEAAADAHGMLEVDSDADHRALRYHD